MITLDAHLTSLYNRELITADEAVERAQDSMTMREKLTAAGAKLRTL
jgi:twitching motility protein PilT